jgi:hypothetical protein
MTRRFEVGPILIALAAIVLLVSLFLEWYGGLTAWDAFEVVDVLLAVLGVAAIVIAVGQLVPDLDYADRGWLSAIVLGVAVLVAAEIINPPPAAGGEDPTTGAWIAFASALVMFVGAVLTFSRVRFALAVEGRPRRERVPVVDHRQDTTETAALQATDRAGDTAATEKASSRGEGDARGS